MIRSVGGWSAVKMIRRSAERIKGDERILGDGNFVESVLKAGQEQLAHRYELQARGYDFNWLVSHVASLFEMSRNEVIRPGRYPATVKARSVLCYWAARELGISTLELSRRLGVSQPTASQSVQRGEKIVAQKKFKLI